MLRYFGAAFSNIVPPLPSGKSFNLRIAQFTSLFLFQLVQLLQREIWNGRQRA
ncbi:hypothetical protein C4K13_3723 [Pseudomonas chlororaphis subsp. aureofaciens]|nr:hypothetical protein C4K13_3723 [Pseudomonas chlororaphis subsp. aureofaciens]AZE36654.1 hypothetical protein C4K06_3622 [Pseudomonas chlororaphis subsp. aureofaciens]SUD54694.1 Uncharacterised protein [Pseudomonas chlororaphis]